MAIDFSNLVIDRVLQGVFEDSNGKVLGALDQIKDLSINTTSESKDATDAQGTLIKRFFNAKQVELSASNAIFNLNLAGIQFGTGKTVATAANKITLPRIKQYTIAAGTTEVYLDDIVSSNLSVYKCDSMGLPSTQYTLAVTADSTHFSKTTNVAFYELCTSSTIGALEVVTTSPTGSQIAVASVNNITVTAGQYVVLKKNVDKITLPTGFTGKIQVKYDYESANGIKLVQSADKFPNTCKFTLSVLVCEPCDAQTLRHMYIVFPSFQMKADVDLSIATDGAHAFSGSAQQSYCSSDKQLYYIAISEDDAE